MFACLSVSQFAKMFLDVLNKIIMCIYNILITIIYHNKNVYYMLADVQAYSGLPNESTGTHPKTWPKMQASTLIRVIL